METLIIDLAEKLIEKDMVGPAVALACVAALLWIFKAKVLGLVVPGFKKKVQLKKHPVFASIKELQAHILPVWTGSGTLKAKLLQKAAIVFIRHFEVFLNKVISAKWDADDIRLSFDALLAGVESELVQTGVPVCFIDCWGRYCRKQTRYVHKYITQADTVVAVYRDDTERKVLLLSVSQPLLYSHIVDLDYINTELNGELETELSKLKV